MHNVGLVNQLSQNTWQNQQQQQQQQQMFGANTQQPMMNLYQSPAPQTSQQLIGAMRPLHQQQPFQAMNNRTSVETPPPKAAPSASEPKKKNDLLDFDVFSEFHTPTLMKTTSTATPALDKTDGASQSALNNIMDLSFDSPLQPSSTQQPSNNLKANSNTDAASASSLLDTSPPTYVASQQLQQRQKQQQQQQQQPPQINTVTAPSKTQQPVSPPLIQNQENYTVPLESLQPGE